MPVTTILLLRHGHRVAWILDPTTGEYTSNRQYPTRLPADPPLASHGVRQTHETADYLSTLLRDEVRQDRLRVYSSLFYRCPETLRPTIEKLRELTRKELLVRGERGVGEWFGRAWFKQPIPGEPGLLKQKFFPWLDETYESRIVPDRHGERIPELHDRVARAFGQIVRDVDEEYERLGRGKEEVTLLVSGHAAQIICTGRVLTGNMPEDPDEEDFKCYTCGISKFVRRTQNPQPKGTTAGEDGDWRTNGGVAGGWDCVVNSNCDHLSQGEERGWHFHGDESFDSYGPMSNAGPITSDGSASPEKLDYSNEKSLNESKL